MSLILHQFRKDLLRTRWLVVLWVSVLLLRFGLVEANADPSDRAWQIAFQLLSLLITLVDSLLVMIIVPLVIQQEPLTTTTAFWLTRPLSRGTLIASKALFGMMLLFLPLLVQGVVLLANGVTPGEVALALLWLFLNQLSWILIVAILAALTSNFGRFAILAVVSFIISFVVMYVIQIARIFGDMESYVSMLPSLTYSRTMVSCLVTIGVALVALVAQYLWRKPRVAWALAAVAFFASNVISLVWSWDFLKPAPDFAEDTSIQASSLTLGLEKHVNTFDRPSFRGGLPRKSISGTIDIGGLPAAGVVRISKLESSLTDAAKRKIPSEPESEGMISFALNRGQDAVEAVLGVPIVDSARGNQGVQQQLFSLDNTDYEKYRAQPLHYEGTAKGIIFKYKKVAELPLKKGAEFRRGSYRLLITDVLHQPDGIDLMAREQDVALQLALRSDQDKNMSSSGNKSVLYLLVNRKLNQAVMEKQNYMNGLSVSLGASGEALRHTPLTIGFGPENDDRSWTIPIDEAWLKDAVLVRMELVPVAPFTKSFSYSDLYLNDSGADVRPRAVTQSFPSTADLDKIVLPPDANRKQVADYIAAIVAASKQQFRWSDSDPEANMLEQVGPENVDLLIQAASENHNYYLNYAIRKLAQPDQKDLILRALPNNHDLIATVIDHHWQQDAKPVLVAALSTVNSLPNRWIDAVAAFRDPATYPALRDYYVQHPHRAAYKSLKSIPDFDLHGAVDAAWKLIDDPTRAWATRNLLVPAAEIGEPDFPTVAARLLEKGDAVEQQFARRALQSFTPATGATDADLLAWMKDNGARLVFDPALKRFVLSASSTQVPSPTPDLQPPSTNAAPASSAPSR